jgi:hypothetical protein
MSAARAARFALLMMPVALAAGCGVADPCDGVPGACLAVHVDSATDKTVDQLEFDILYGAVHGTSITRAAGATTSLPAATAIELGTLAAPVTVALVVAGERSGTVVGSAVASTGVAPNAHVAVHVTLTAGPTGCSDGALYCGGDKLPGDPQTLYRCNTGRVPTARGACAAGCLVRSGQNDACKGAGGTCVVPGHYCGGDKLDGDPQTLYTCEAGGSGSVMTVCAEGCQVNKSGQDDACK